MVAREPRWLNVALVVAGAVIILLGLIEQIGGATGVFDWLANYLLGGASAAWGVWRLRTDG